MTQYQSQLGGHPAWLLQEGDYGKQRMWGAIGWGGFSIVAGAIITRYGLHSSFYTYMGAALIALGPTALLPVQALQKKHPELAPQLPGDHPDEGEPTSNASGAQVREQ